MARRRDADYIADKIKDTFKQDSRATEFWNHTSRAGETTFEVKYGYARYRITITRLDGRWARREA